MEGNAKELFPVPWLKVEDLGASEKKLIILDVRKERMKGELAPVVYFVGVSKYLFLNRGVVDEMISAIGTQDLLQWNGKTVVLYPGINKKGNPTIHVKAA